MKSNNVELMIKNLQKFNTSKPPEILMPLNKTHLPNMLLDVFKLISFKAEKRKNQKPMHPAESKESIPL